VNARIAPGWFSIANCSTPRPIHTPKIKSLGQIFFQLWRTRLSGRVRTLTSVTLKIKTAPLTSVVLGIPHSSQVFPNKTRTLPKAMQHGFNPISSIYVMRCEKKVTELKHHAVLVYENVLFAEGRSLAFRSPLNVIEHIRWLYSDANKVIVYRLSFEFLPSLMMTLHQRWLLNNWDSIIHLCLMHWAELCVKTHDWKLANYFKPIFPRS
jgi:hypothetical protein